MDALLTLSIPAMAAILLAATYAAAAAVHVTVTRLARGEAARAFKGISPGMLPPLAIIFAILVGFLAAQVWNESDRATSAVNREASALRTAVLLSSQFPGESARLQGLVRQHVRTAVTEEWPAMAHRDANLRLVPGALGEALAVALALEPRTAGETVAQRELVVAIEGALDARRQRIVLSGSSVNAVKWGALLVQAFLILLTIAMVHADNPAASRIILGIFATGAAVSILLLAAHSRPFAGAIAVRPTLLQQVIPEEGGDAP